MRELLHTADAVWNDHLEAARLNVMPDLIVIIQPDSDLLKHLEVGKDTGDDDPISIMAKALVSGLSPMILKEEGHVMRGELWTWDSKIVFEADISGQVPERVLSNRASRFG